MCRFFFFNDTATTEIYTLSLHDALPICRRPARGPPRNPPPHAGVSLQRPPCASERSPPPESGLDRKSTRLNSSHANISYAVFCLKKKRRLLKILTTSPLITSSLDTHTFY